MTRRPALDARGGSRRWRFIRLQQLRREPRCRRCGEPATEVDHRVPRSEGGGDQPSNLASLCSPCHVTKTREDRERVARERRIQERDLDARYGRRAPD